MTGGGRSLAARQQAKCAGMGPQSATGGASFGAGGSPGSPALRPPLLLLSTPLRTHTQSGKVTGDPAIGRYLADTLALVPHLARPDFERLFNESVQVRSGARPGAPGAENGCSGGGAVTAYAVRACV